MSIPHKGDVMCMEEVCYLLSWCNISHPQRNNGVSQNTSTIFLLHWIDSNIITQRPI